MNQVPFCSSLSQSRTRRRILAFGSSRPERSTLVAMSPYACSTLAALLAWTQKTHFPGVRCLSLYEYSIAIWDFLARYQYLAQFVSERTHPMPPKPINAARVWICDFANIKSSLPMISSRPMNLRSLAKGTVEEGTTILGFLANSAIAHSQLTATRGKTTGTQK